jgi:hypothetical protein
MALQKKRVGLTEFTRERSLNVVEVCSWQVYVEIVCLGCA